MPADTDDAPLSIGRRLLIYLGFANAPGPRSQGDKVRDAVQIAVAILLIVIVLSGAEGSTVTALIAVGVAVLLATAVWSAIARRKLLAPAPSDDTTDDEPGDLRARAREAARARREQRKSDSER